MNTLQHTNLIKQQALQLGFEYCGISRAERLDDDAQRLDAWLNKGMHGKMGYMENHFDLRVDPTKLVPGAKSVISLLYSYFNNQSLLDKQGPKISKYAFGKDYHIVLKEKLYALFEYIKEKIGDVNGRVFVDSGPVLERAWAAKSGLGWIGKNGNLINKQNGSFYFLAEIILDLELVADSPVKNYCGTCTKCIDNCPTDAILENAVIDGSKCISYFTIELKEQIPATMKGKFEDWMFGCDICQDVCPWNRFAKQHQEPQFIPSAELLNMRQHEWEELSEQTFKKVFKQSPLKRANWKGIKRNIEFLKPTEKIVKSN